MNATLRDMTEEVVCLCVERGDLNKPSALRNYGNVNELFVFPIEGSMRKTVNEY